MSFYAIAFVVSFQVLSYELALFHLLNYQFSYLQAVLGISLALGGLGLGAAASTARDDREFGYRLLRKVIAIGLGLWSVPLLCLLPLPSWATMILLGLPFLPAGALLSLLFAARPASRLYACDLLGAATAALAFPWLWRALSMENFSSALAALGFALAALLAARRKGLTTAAGAGLLAVLSATSVCANYNLDFLNLGRQLPATGEFPGKLFNEGAPPREVLFSRSDPAQRIDFMPAPYSSVGKEALETYLDGRRVDVTRNILGSPLDFRLAGGLGMANPAILVIGSSAEGVAKQAKLLSQEVPVTALEINLSTIHLMEGDLFNLSRHAYADIELHEIDGRTFMETPGPAYDLISLLNTHMAHDVGDTLSPDFLHTREALTTALGRLTPRGFLSLEERNPDRNSQVAIDRLLSTILEALWSSNRRPPSKYVAIYQIYGLLHNRQRPNDDRFVVILVRNQPFTAAENEYLNIFESNPRALLPAGPVRFGFAPTKLLYLPDGSRKSRYGRHIEQWQMAKYRSPGWVSANLISDDKPYPASTASREWLPAAALMAIWGLTLGLVGAGEKQNGRRALCCCGLAGIANSLVQTLLLQRLQIFTGSPGSALGAVLGATLLAGALGSWLWGGRPLSRRLRVLAVAAAGATLLGVFQVPLQDICPLTYPIRILLVWLASLPLAFVVGSFLPSLTRDGPDPIRLFAVSSLAGAVAVPLALLATQNLGHLVTLTLAVAAALTAALIWPDGVGCDKTYSRTQATGGDPEIEQEHPLNGHSNADHTHQYAGTAADPLHGLL